MYTFNHDSVTQLTQAEAIACCENKHWEKWGMAERALFQACQDRLCMPLDVYKEALRVTLGRPVFSHEIGYPELLKAEILGLANSPTLDQIIALLPKDKIIIVNI